ncbi:tenascin [Melanotaenia boesemani]|uniref:tenascin n=1 Tax=Melanotaenia boesemani TaxID=1250792 RepID=UPI001C03D11D|nr:tenascin [Melanotaenia boesemani]XP_041844611.1 tenascin [Melanotaenia boesemani]
MLFTLGLLLLLTPFPSFQTTTNEKRDGTGSDVAKAHAVYTLSKPKTTAARTKQVVHSTLKPNTVSLTVLPSPASNQKPSTVNATAATKSRPGSVVIQTTPSSTLKVTTASGTLTNKDKQVSGNHTVQAKTTSNREVKATKERPALTGAPNVHSTTPPLVTRDKATKDKPQQSANHTASVKSTSTSDGKTAKDKPAPTAGQNVQSTSIKSTPASGTKTTKNKPAASVNQTVVHYTPPTSDMESKDKPAPTKVQTVLSAPVKVDKDKVTDSKNHTTQIRLPSSASKEKPPPSQPITVVISDGCDSSHGKEQEIKLKPGTPLVMTHKINLQPGGCTGGCEAEMAALKGRVARLEREMSSLKEKCPCSANCPNNCGSNGECEKGKCICQQGFIGPDCRHDKVKPKVTTALQVNKHKENIEEKITKVQQTVIQKKEQKKGSEVKDTDTKHSKGKPGVGKAQDKQDASDKQITVKVSLNGQTKTSRPTAGQDLLKNDGLKQEEARKGKTTLLATKTVHQKTDHLKDEPQSNVTQGHVKKVNGTAKIVTILSKVIRTNKTRIGKESLEQSMLTEKNVTQLSGHKKIKTLKLDSESVQSVDSRKISTDKTAQRKESQKSKYVVNATTVALDSNVQNKTTIQDSLTSTRRTGGLGSVKAVNISSFSFTVTWLAPQGMFNNFTVIRKEPQTEGNKNQLEGFEEETHQKDKMPTSRNGTEVHKESTTASSRGKTETKRISMVVPGNVHSVEFSNLRANTHYVLHVYGTGEDRRSKIHRVTATTGPEPPTDMVLSNVTQSSLTVSWTKPKTTFTGFRVTYINIVTGEGRFVTVNSQQSHVVLSELSAGSSYIISVATTQGRAQSDALTSVITTVPAPPTHLQVVNVTDTRAVLQWTPSLGKVDHFILSYESSKTPNVTVTVMLSGNSVDHQLRGLQRGTLYTVKVLSQKDSLQSMAISTTFTTANVVKASEIEPRTAVITWKTSVVYHSYRVLYQVAGEETKEVVLEPTVTECKLTGLLPMSHYTVVVQGEKNGQYTSVVTSEFMTGKLRFPFPTECSQELLNGALRSGEVDIYPQGKGGQVVRVYCDMETDGGGWTVFQRRMNGKTDFYRTWSEYRAGFGNLSDEFWLGNELLHNLTSVGPVSLRVDMRSGNDVAYALYANFSVGSEERHYALTVSGYTGTAGDSMGYHNGRPFSGRDKDPVPLGIHCAKAYMGGWWYNNCYRANFNGLYGINSNNQGVVWIDWKGKDFSIPFTEMKFRPSRFSPTTYG